MGKQVSKLLVKKADGSGLRTASIHKIQSALGIVFPGKSPVDALHGQICHLHAVDSPIHYRGKLTFFVDYLCNTIGKFLAPHPVHNHIGYQNTAFCVADPGLCLDNL